MTYRVIHRGETRAVPKEFSCADHGYFVADAYRDDDEAFCPACGLASPWTPRKVPAIRMRRVEAVRGKSDQVEHKGWLDTSHLEEGQDPDEFWSDREKVHEELRKELVTEMVRSDR